MASDATKQTISQSLNDLKAEVADRTKSIITGVKIPELESTLLISPTDQVIVETNNGTKRTSLKTIGDVFAQAGIVAMQEVIDARNDGVTNYPQLKNRLDAMDGKTQANTQQIQNNKQEIAGLTNKYDTINKEVADARESNDGVVHNTLKERLDADTQEVINARTDNRTPIETHNSLKERLDSDYDYLNSEIEETNTQLSYVKKNILVTPDDFEGSDIEKMQKALDYAIANDLTTIRLNRLYNITGGSIMLPSSDFWGFILFEQGGIIKNDEGFIFDRNSNDKNCNSPKLKDVFVETSSENVYLYDGDKMIRQNCDNVTFWRVVLFKTTGYVQSIRLHNCEIGQLGCNFIESAMAYDVELMHNRFESSTSYHALKIQTQDSGISYFGLRIKSNLFEGYVYTCPIIVGVGYGLDISSNYFEANNTSIMIDNLNKQSTLVCGRIFNNVFGATKSNYDVEILGTVFTHKLYVGQNTSDVPPGKYIFNKYLLKHCEPDTNNAYAGGQTFFNDNNSVEVEDSGYHYTQIDLGNGGVMFEIPLHLNDKLYLWQQSSKQFLFNFKMTFGSSVWYSAHLTGILSIDGYYVDGAVKQGLHVDVLSSRNTSGNVNGNTGNPVQFDCFFKESGGLTMDSNATDATIVFKFPNLNYNAQHNVCSFKSINSITQKYSKDN